MAKFKLYLLTFQNDIKEKNQLSNKYLANLISEFTSQVSTKTIGGDTREHFIYNTNNSFCYTYEEQLSLHQNSQKELTFKMDFRVYRDDRLEDNPYAQNLIVGSQLLLEDAYGQQHLFTVKNIDIEISNVNTVCTYSCQDSFTFQLSKQNDGYEITNDINDEDFIGAHTIDWWVQKKIVPECFIYYQYVPLAEKGYTDDYYKQTIPFSGSGTADSVLISLGETLDLNLHVYEHFNEEDGTLTQQFWFEPSKNPEVSGLSYSPYANLQNLSLTHKGDSLTSVLNVYGGTFGDERITLLPTIPMLFKKVFASDEWMKTPYYQGMFNDIVYGQTIKINLDDIDEEFIYNKNIVNYIAIDFSKIIDITSLKWLNYYDYYKFANIDNSTWANVGYTGEANYILHSAITKQWFLGDENQFYNSYEDFYKTIQNENKNIYLYIPITSQEEPRLPKKEDGTINEIPPLKTSLSGIFYLSFYRQPAEDETMFATIAEECPWLENKLLDFSYFINHNLLNSYEYGILIQQIYNNLRQTNGRLIYLADSYYKALSEKTKFLAQLDERVTNLGAKFTAEFLQPYLNQKQIREEDVQDFLLDYKTLYAVPEAKRAIFNYDEIYSNYINKYLNAEQRFLKSIYDFTNYWNAPVTIEGAQTIYCYTAYPSSGYSFSENQFSTRNFKDYDEKTLEPKTTIFSVETNKPVDIVYTGNYSQFKWAKYAENTFIECSEENKNNSYDREKTYYKKVSTSAGEGESTSIEIAYQPLKLDALKTNFLINTLGNNEESTDYYFRNRESYRYDFLSLGQISNFYDKFTSKALLKIINYNFLSDQDNLTEDQIKEWLQKTRTTDNRTLLGLKVYNYLYTTTFPIQEIYNYEDVYQLEGGNYVRQNTGKKYQAIPIVNASNYMNFYKRVSVSNEEYKTSQVLATVTGVSTAVSFISACLGPVGWIVAGIGTVTATICGAIACSKVSNKNTWWSNDGYTNKDITLDYTLPNQGLYNKLIQYDKIDYTNGWITLEAKHFYYTTSEKDYDNYKVWNSQGYADLYFNKYSKFIPNYHYIQQHAQENKYMYKPSYLRLVKPDEYVNSADEYLMLIYDTEETGDLHYFNGIFENTFKSYINSESNLINNVHYFLFEQLSDSFSFNDFGDISNKTLKQVLEKQFVFDGANAIEGQSFSLKLKGSTYYIIIFHKEDYTVSTIKKSTLEKDLTNYQYVFYNSKNDEAFNPNHEDNFVKGLYLPASEDSLTPDDLEDAKAFDKERLYYKIENDKVIYYPTIIQAIQQGNSYYYYTQSNNLIWRTEKLTDPSISLEVYDQTQKKFVQQNFTLYNKYQSIDENQIFLSSTINLKNLTNSSFWNQYTNISNKNLTFLKEHAMIIETDLTNYWNQAYNASQLCQYFIPEHWQSYYDNQANPFVLFTLAEAEIKTIAKKDIDAINILKIFLEDDDGTKPMTQDYLASIYKNKKEGLPLYIWFHGNYLIVNYNKDAPEGTNKYTTITLDANLSNLLSATYPNAEIAKIDYYNTSEASNFMPEQYPGQTQYFQQRGQGYEMIVVNETINTVSYQVSTPLKLNTQWIPKVEKVLNNQNPYTFKLKYFSDTSEYFNYISDYSQDLRDQNKNDSNYQIIPLSDFAHWEPFTSLIQKFNLDVDKWLLIPQYVSTQGTYFKRTTGGTTWADLLQQLYPNKGSFPYFDGYYGLYMNYLKPENFIDGKMSEYEKYQTKHQELWSSLYKQFPSILLEQKYQNEDATNSLELLQMAKLAMQDFNNIEREYNITTIDTFALKGYEGQQINIGDSIALNAEELYTGFDDIKESLKQYLFVTDISYTLRQDTDVNLTVNKIKYQDKMIQQLAKLIK